jgi:hypothetical protein
MKQIEKIQDRPDIYRDIESGAIISKNVGAYNVRKKLMKQKEEEKNKINNLEAEVAELKSIMKQLLEKGNA